MILFLINQVNAQDIGLVTKLKIPRYVSLKSDDVNLRVGPSLIYPIKINYIKKNLPIEIINEYEVWREVKDIDGNIGWIHKSLLKGDRYGIITANDEKIFVYSYPNGKKIGEIGNRNIIKLNKCIMEWCYINISNKNGWINKDFIWGVYNSEIYKVYFYQPIINFYWKILNKITKQ
tara:strand:+ start:127 stop:654 length:528 start_codon:yes stop_codon:yes gene_type:complete